MFLSYLVVQCKVKPCSRSCNGRKLSVQTCHCGAMHFDVHYYGVHLQFFKLYSYKGTIKFLHLHGLMFYVLLNIILRVHNLNFIYYLFRPSPWNVLFPIARPTYFFGKVKKKIQNHL